MIFRRCNIYRRINVYEFRNTKSSRTRTENIIRVYHIIFDEVFILNRSIVFTIKIFLRQFKPNQQVVYIIPL